MRRLLVVAALAVAAVPAVASAAQPPPPVPFSCHVQWTAIAQWTYDVPVVGGDYVYTPSVVCYG